MLVDNPLEEWQQPYGVDEFVQMLRARTPEMSAELRKAGFEILGGEDMKGVWNNNPDYIKYPRPNWRTAGKDYAYYVRRIVLAGKKAGVQVEHPER
jgi:3-methyladenine DNA glycosylase Tag